MFLYHGSPIIIENDRDMASSTYFSEDIKVAKEYGQYVYKIKIDEKIKGLFYRDIFKEHWISGGHIPLYMFDIIDTAKDGIISNE